MTTRFSVRLVLILFVTVVFAAALSAQNSTSSTQSSTTCNQTQTSATCQTPAPTCATCPTPSGNQTTSTSTGGMGGELYVNAGGIWPTRIDTFNNNKIKAQGIYGLKGGIFFGDSFELEGSFGYLNHFEPSRSPNPLDINTVDTFGQPSILGFLYDMNFAWNFGNRSLFGARFAPYVVFGGGGLTTEVRHGSSAFLNGGGVVPVEAPFVGGTVFIANPAPTHIIHDGDTFFTVNYGGGIKAMNLWGPVGLRADVRGRTIPNFYHSSPTWPEVTGGLLFTFGER